MSEKALDYANFIGKHLVVAFGSKSMATTTVKDLRWWAFRKKNESELPSPRLELRYSIRTTATCIHTNLRLEAEDNEWLSMLTTLPPAADAIIQLVKCVCVKEKCANNRCKFHQTNLNFSDLCNCSESGERWENRCCDSPAQNWRRRGI